MCPDGTSSVRISTCNHGTDFNTLLKLFSAGDETNFHRSSLWNSSLTFIDENENDYDCEYGNKMSTIVTDVKPGNYGVFVYGYENQLCMQGHFNLSIELIPTPPIRSQHHEVQTDLGYLACAGDDCALTHNGSTIEFEPLLDKNSSCGGTALVYFTILEFFGNEPPECICKDVWGLDYPGCAQQVGCPQVACDGVSRTPWCVVMNPGCDGDFGNGLSYCSPSNYEPECNDKENWLDVHGCVEIHFFYFDACFYFRKF